MKIQLWSYNYDPEPLGIAPVSRVWAQAMKERGHEIEVIAAHPHYPEPRWGWRLRPYREMREGIWVTRLPLIPGRSSGARRMLQELSFVVAQTLALPFLRTPDVMVVVSPSFPALLPAMLNARFRRKPWVLWLKDILPAGAASTGYMKEGTRPYKLAQRLESSAYASASKIVVLSHTFREDLLAKGVPASKLILIHDPATRPLRPAPKEMNNEGNVPQVLCMGNIGKSQNLEAIVRAFQEDAELERLGARLVVTGTGVAADEVQSAIRSDRIEMKGVLSDDELERELTRASVGAVTQHYEGSEFNVPSKVMNYFGAGLPVIASVHPEGEVARLLQESGGGWVTNSGDSREFAAQSARVLSQREELQKRGRAGWEFAHSNFSPEALALRFEQELGPLLR